METLSMTLPDEQIPDKIILNGFVFHRVKRRTFADDAERQEARKEYRRQLYQKNKDTMDKTKIYERNKIYRESNGDKVREYNRQYYQANIEKHRQYYQENREHINQLRREKYKRDKELEL